MPAQGRALLRLAAASLVLVSMATLAAGELAMPWLSPARLVPLLLLVTLLALAMLAVVMILSIHRAPQFVDAESGQVRVGALLRGCGGNPVPALLAMLIAAWGITGVGNLTEIYRVTEHRWYDAELWMLEKPLFDWLLASPLNVPQFWDAMYFLLWVYLIAALALLYVLGARRLFHDCLFAALIAFYVARCWAQLTPAAGPVFFVPEVFEIGGTLSERTQHLLSEYMQGNLMQRGDIPGTTAMPSLHIALTMIAMWYLARWRRASLCFGVPWLVLIWLSTLFMGWHYAVDGLAGAGVAAAGVAAARIVPGRAREGYE